ncbi:RNA polymerase subunit sigma, partial [Blautia pseudococcoides]|nr:RNA polymerase subunit sigma [Blautia pseudococcoides]
MEWIYTKYAVQVYKYLFSLCRNPHTAEELTQETFFRAMK